MKRARLFLCGMMLPGFFMNAVANAAPVELGKVKWSRDYDATLAAASKSGKPVLILFQEVPG